MLKRLGIVLAPETSAPKGGIPLMAIAFYRQKASKTGRALRGQGKVYESELFQLQVVCPNKPSQAKSFRGPHLTRKSSQDHTSVTVGSRGSDDLTNILSMHLWAWVTFICRSHSLTNQVDFQYLGYLLAA